jgi:release factor glutamine methyltransferase
MKKSANKYYQEIKQEISSIYEEEASTIAYFLLEEIYGIKKVDLILNKDLDLDADLDKKLNGFIKRLLKHEPLQYILGYTEFYGLKISVTPDVLIPRPETEELVHLIINDWKDKNPQKIFDICTGSGCIPVSLKANFPKSEVFGLDISEEALNVAKLNAKKNKVSVSYYKSDILKEELPQRDLDVIVSNPPYVKDSEKELMKQNVLNFEPHLALFVSDADPLIFYKEIIKKAKGALKIDGKIYFEINEALAEEIKSILIKENFHSIKIHKDLQGKDRIAEATGG